MNNELEMERSQVELLQKDTLRQKQEVGFIFGKVYEILNLALLYNLI